MGAASGIVLGQDPGWVLPLEPHASAHQQSAQVSPYTQVAAGLVRASAEPMPDPTEDDILATIRNIARGD
jgi:hypothetical protein